MSSIIAQAEQKSRLLHTNKSDSGFIPLSVHVSCLNYQVSTFCSGSWLNPLPAGFLQRRQALRSWLKPNVALGNQTRVFQALTWLWGTLKCFWTSVMIPVLIIKKTQMRPSAKRRLFLLLKPVIGFESQRTRTKRFTAGRPLFLRWAVRLPNKRAGWEIPLQNCILVVIFATTTCLAVGFSLWHKIT